jgi:hypothetical protein
MLIHHAHRVLLAGPIDPSAPTIRHDHHSLQTTRSTESRRQVPWRLLADGALRA